MKKFLFALSLFVIACDSEKDNITLPLLDVTQVSEILNSNNWVITYYYDSNSEKTANFSGYVFDFSTSGILTATGLNDTIVGSWSLTDSDSSSNDDDSSNNDSYSDDEDNLDFYIWFSSPANFAELSDDWDIMSVSDTIIELIDQSGGNGGTDFLTFELQ